MKTATHSSLNLASMHRFIHISMGILLVACITFISQSTHAGIAGHVLFVNGKVQATNSAGQSRDLQKGDAVHESDTVTTGKNASAQIRMRDGGMIAVRPDSQLKFDSFVFMGKEDGTERSFLSLLKGGLRAITGLIGQKNKPNYRIDTVASTIGIRGTDHEVYVVVPGSELATRVPVGTYNKVNVGETVMTTSQGTVNVLPNQMGFVVANDQMPLLQPVNLNLFTAVPVPTPQTLALPARTGEAARDSAVVDGAVQEQNTMSESVIPKSPTLLPIIQDQGPGAPPKVF